MSELLEAMNKINQRVGELDDKLAAATGTRNAGIGGLPGAPAPAPAARMGADTMGSKGFSFMKLMGHVSRNGIVEANDVKNELDLCHRFKSQAMKLGWRPQSNQSILIPFAPEFLGEDEISPEMRYEVKSMIDAGVRGYDRDEAAYYHTKMMAAMGTKSATPASPAMSWTNQSLGGAFVPPAEMGSPIELLRNAAAFPGAGATVIPLPPQGSIGFPRQTGPSTGYWIGENQAITASQPATDQLLLSAKGAASLVIFPNSLLRFANPTIEGLIRQDMFKTCALTLDYALLYGGGGAKVPSGIVTQMLSGGSGINQVTGSTSATQLAGQDLYTFLSKVYQNNITPTHWMMNPAMLFAFASARWISTTTPSKGGFLFDFTRGADGKVVPVLAGLPVVITNQIPVNRGTGAQTSLVCLNGEQMLVGMWGAIEWTQTDGGYTLLASDQCAVRAIIQCDGGARYPGGIAIADPVNATVSDT